jgi:hypothetical protein
MVHLPGERGFPGTNAGKETSFAPVWQPENSPQTHKDTKEARKPFFLRVFVRLW